MTWHYRRVGAVQKTVSKPRAPTKWAEAGTTKAKLGEQLQERLDRVRKMDEPLRVAALEKILQMRAAYLKKHNLTSTAKAPEPGSDPIPNLPYISAKQPKGMNYVPWGFLSASELCFNAFYPSQQGCLYAEPCKAFYGMVAAPPALTEDGVWVLVLDASREPAYIFATHAEPKVNDPKTAATAHVRTTCPA